MRIVYRNWLAVTLRACNLYGVQTVHKVGLLCMCAGPKKGQLPSYRSTDSSECFFFLVSNMMKKR